MPAPVKIKQLDELKGILQEHGDFVVTTYSGLTVAQMIELRERVRETSGRLKVVKNNLFYRALQELQPEVAEGIKDELHGPIAVTFVPADFPAVTKVLVEYAKKSEKVNIKSGAMDKAYLKKQDLENIATLPSKDELLGIIGRGLNAPATKIATGVNQIMASLARGIKQVGEKNGD